jgi:hypothetical protein
MEQERIAQLLEKYWQAETTVEEEKMLAEYFRGTDLPSEWEPYREIFSWYEEEKQVKPGEGLEKRIMEQLRPRPRLHGAWWAAAAVIIVGLGVSLLVREAPPAGVKDTYNDPQQALAAVQKALLVASRNMNKGLRPLK